MGSRIAVYAGSFDPPTNGHLWMIQQGAKVFDTLYVAIGENPDKRCQFSLSERLAILKEITVGLKTAVVDSFYNQFLIEYAKSVGAQYILRGIRSVSDYEYERAMRNINQDLCLNITSWFLMPPRDITEISSSMVKGLVGPKGWEEIVKQYVPSCVYNKLKEKDDKRKAKAPVA